MKKILLNFNLLLVFKTQIRLVAVLFPLLTIVPISVWGQLKNSTNVTADDQQLNSSHSPILNVIKPLEFSSQSDSVKELWRSNQSVEHKSSTEIVDKRDRYSKTFANPDGSFSKTQSNGPMHYKDVNGNWLPYDAKLVANKSKEGLFKLAGTDLDITLDISTGETQMNFTKQSGISFGKNADIKIINQNGDVDLLETGEFTNHSKFEKTDKKVVIKDVFSGIDRIQNFEYYKIKTDYIINERPVFNNNAKHMVFEDEYIVPQGYKIVKDKEYGKTTDLGWEGDLLILDENNNEIARMHKPIYFDASAIDGSCNNSGEASAMDVLKVNYKKENQTNEISGAYEILSQKDGVYKIRLIVPVSWLNDENTVYPVVIDPTASMTYSSGNIRSCKYSSVQSVTKNIAIPAGSTVTAAQSQWQYKAQNGQYRNEVYTRIGGNNATYAWFNCNNSSSGLCNITPGAQYNNIANGFYASGIVPITIGITRTWGGWGCNTTYSYITNGSWITTITYTPPAGPSNPTAISVGETSGVANNDGIICSGAPVSLTANGAVGTVYWFTGSCATTGQIATGNSITVNPTSTTTYFARNFNGGQWSAGCASTTITVNPVPLVSASAASNPICIGSTSQLNTSVTGLSGSQVFSYSQSGYDNTYFFIGGTTSGMPAGATITSISWTGNIGTYCPSWYEMDFWVNGVYLSSHCNGTYTYNGLNGQAANGQLIKLRAWDTDSYGDLVTMTFVVTVNYTTPAPVYSWSPSASLTNPSIQNPIASPSSTTTYTVTATANGCSGTGQVTVTVNAAPTISINASANAVCSGTPTTLTASGASTYVWAQGGTAASTQVSPNATTTYTVTGTSAGGCTGTAQSTISVNAAPVVTISANTNSVCAGNTATLNASGASTYVWAQGGTAASTQVSPNATTTYTVTGTSAGGCTGTAQSTISVIAAPIANAGADVTSDITCGKDNTQLSAAALANGETGVWAVTGLGAGAVLPGLTTLPGSNVTTFTGSYGGTYTLTWTVTNAANCISTDNMIVTFNQPNAASLGGMIGSQDVLWNGLSSSDWSTSNNWYQKQAAGHYVRMTAGQPSITNKVFTINQTNGGMCVGNNNPTLSISSNAEDVYVGPGVTLNLTNDSLNLAGNLVNDGTLVAAIGTVNFTGSANGFIGGTGNTQLFNLRVDKSGGSSLSLQQPVLVTNTLTMVQGNVNTTTANLLTLGQNSTTTGNLVYGSGSIVGPFRRFYASSATSGDAGLFPVGTSAYNRYARVNFTSSPGTNQYLTVRYVTGAPMSGGIPLYNGLPLMITGAMIQNYSADGYWQVDPTGGSYSSSIASTSYDVTLFANNLTGMTTPQICRIIKSPGSASSGSNHVVWQACGTPVAVATGAAPSSFAITSTASTGFSWFNIGSPNGQALPVELMSFSGNCADGQVNLEWQTASEHNSLYFEVEKSRDGENWQVLSTVPSAGNSTELLTYSAVDAHAGEGNNYYRLNQVDIDGANKVYDIINVSCSGGNKGYFSTYPNPSSGAFQVVLNNKEMLGTATLSIRDTKGASLLQRGIEVKPGINLFSINDLNLAPGVYYIQVINGDQTTEVIKEVIR